MEAADIKAATDDEARPLAEPSEHPTVGGVEDNQDDDKVNVAKAIRFWTHPSLKDVPLEQKRQYLHEKGVTDAQIHEAWDRLLEGEDDSLSSLDKQKASHALQSQAEQRIEAINTNSRNSSSNYSQFGASPHTNRQQYFNPTPVVDANNSNSNSTSYYPPPPPQQHQYEPPSSSYYPPRFEEEEGAGAFLQGATLVALGGFVGLAAAAGLRWLNGGDFQLLPPPFSETHSAAEKRRLQLDSSNEHGATIEGLTSFDQEENDEEEFEDDDNYSTREDDEHLGEVLLPEDDGKLYEQIESISASLKSHVTLQEKILNRLSSQGSSITNHSMELLRASNGASKNNCDALKNSSSIETSLKMWGELLEIKGRLQDLKMTQDDRNPRCDSDKTENVERLTATLLKLEDCIESIRDMHISPPTTEDNLATVQDSTSPVPTLANSDHPKSAFCTQDIDPEVERNLSVLHRAIYKIAQENTEQTLRAGAQIMYLYISNLIGSPKNPRYRKIFTSNESFKKIEGVVGGKELLEAIGFKEVDGHLEWLHSDSSSAIDGEELAFSKLQQAKDALGILKGGQISPSLTAKALAVLSSDEACTIVDHRTISPEATEIGKDTRLNTPNEAD